MDLADRGLRRGPSGDSARIDPGLDIHVGAGFELQVSFGWILAVVVSERPLDIDRMRIVAFDEIAVVAVHRANQVGKPRHDPGRETAPQCGRRPHDLHR
jgi:hypothetical protein